MLKTWLCSLILVTSIFRSAMAAPLNDNLANATVISGIPFEVLTTNADATMESEEPQHANSNPGASVWYTWTPSTTTYVSIKTAGSNFDTILGVYTGSGYPLANVASNDDTPPTSTSYVEFEAQAGTAYKIAIAGYSGAVGTIQLSIDPAVPSVPTNDNWANAESLTGTNTGKYSNNNNATAEPDENAHAGQAAVHSIWYSWTAPVSDNIQFDTLGSSIDTVLAAYTGNGFPLTEIASSDDYGFSHFSQFSLDVIAGTTYYFAVDGKAGATGETVFRIYGPPVNDKLINAYVLTTQNVSTYGTNIEASPEPNENAHGGKPADLSIWWKWIPQVSEPISIDTNGSGPDTVLAIYTGDTFPLNLVAEDDDSGDDTASSVTISAEAGTSYYIAVDSRLNQGFIALHIQGSPPPPDSPPANDNLADATPVTDLSETITATNAGATVENDEPNHAGIQGFTSVWWSWTATFTGPVNVNTSTSNFDTLLGIYTGETYPLTEIASDDDSGGNGTSFLTFNAVEGTTYKIAVCGFQNETGDIVLNIKPPLVNDDLANAIAIASSLPATVNGSNQGASKEVNEPNHADTGGASVWWSWTPSESGSVQIDTIGSNFDTLLGVYTGSGYPLTLIGSADDDPNAPNNTSLVIANVQAGVTYYIAVDGYAAASGDIVLNITSMQIPDNDNLANASSITNLPVTINSTNLRATKEQNERNHANEAGGTSVWWTWTAPTSGRVNVDTIGSDFDTLLAVYRGSNHPLTNVASDDESGGNNTSSLSFNATSGTTYKIVVDGYQRDTGNIVLHMGYVVALANDNLANATVISSIPTTITATNVGATKETSESNHAGQSGGTTVWWRWTSNINGPVTVSTTGSSFDTLLAVYTGSSYPLTLIASDDETGGNHTSKLSFTAVSGTTYRIVVDGYHGATGPITLYVGPSVPPSNDNLVNATILPSDDVLIADTNIAATKEPGEPSHAGDAGGASVWYSWIAPSTGKVYISTGESNFRTMVGVYTGQTYPLTLLAENKNNTGPVWMGTELVFDAVAGTTYKIAVDGIGGAQGGLILYILNAPPYLEATTRLDANPTNATSIRYGIQFSEAVTGVDISDFGLTVNNGVTTAAVTSIDGSGTSYTVTTTVGPGDGTVSLTVLMNDTILDIDENPLVVGPWGPANTAQYNIDRTAPVVNSITPIDARNINITFTDVSNMGIGVIDAANYTLSGAGQGTVSPHPSSITLVSGKTYRLTWSSGGMINGQPISIEVSNVFDAAGNQIVGSTIASGTALPVSLSAFSIE